jgi:hypothetical protein
MGTWQGLIHTTLSVQAITSALTTPLHHIMFVLADFPYTFRHMLLPSTKAIVWTDVMSLQPTHTGCSIVFSVITNIYNKKTKGPSLMELFTATGKLKKVFFDN